MSDLTCPHCGSTRVEWGTTSGRFEGTTPFCRSCGLGGDFLEPSNGFWRHNDPCPTCGSHELGDGLRCSRCEGQRALWTPAGQSPRRGSGDAMNAPHGRCYCPSCQTRAALHLLETGRPAMAQAILRDMVECLDEAERDAAVEAAFMNAAAQLPAADVENSTTPPPPELYQPPTEWPVAPGRAGFPRLAAELRQHVARLGPQRVADLLRVRVADLVPILAGTVDVSKDALKRVRSAEA